MVLKFDDYNKLNEEEGWKTNILVGLLSLLGVQAMGQIKDDGTKLTTTTNLENSMKSYLAQGWHLDSTTVDTIFAKTAVEKPDTKVIVARLKFDKNQYFESGKFALSKIVQDSIYNTMMGIANEGMLINIIITSSTDKQAVSQNLQKQLKNLGYSADNKGLSKARAAGVKSYLESLGVNDSLIAVQENFEQGSGEIDQSARYVAVDIYYIQIKPTTKPEISTSMKVNKTYHMSKNYGSYKTQGKPTLYKKPMGPIKHFKFQRPKCFGWKT